VKVDADLPTLVETQAILLYHSVRELLFNVLKHAKTDAADVSLKQKKDGALEVTVRDYGKGCDLRLPDPHHRTFGLFSIQERVEAMEGRLSIESWTGEGMKVVVTVPLQSPQVSHQDYPHASPPLQTPIPPNQFPESVIPPLLQP
jgi:signal transduction histidine kinase